MTQDDANTPRSIAVPSTIVISTRRSQDTSNAFFITLNEWHRLKRFAKKIKPVVAWWSIWASVFAGLAFSCAVNWLATRNSKSADINSVNANGIVAIFALILAIICIFADRRERNRTFEDAEELLHEMDVVERSNPESFPSVGSR